MERLTGTKGCLNVKEGLEEKLRTEVGGGARSPLGTPCIALWWELVVNSCLRRSIDNSTLV